MLNYLWVLLVSNMITTWKIAHLSFSWNNAGRMLDAKWFLKFWSSIDCCFILCATSDSSSITGRVPPTAGNWHPIKPHSQQSWTGNMLQHSPVFISWQAVIRTMLPQPGRVLPLSVYTLLHWILHLVSSTRWCPPRSSHNRLALVLAFVPGKSSVAKSLCAELLPVLCCCSLSISHPLQQCFCLSAPATWVLLAEQPWAAAQVGTARGGCLCTKDLSLSPALRRAGCVAWLQWGHPSAWCHCPLKQIAGERWWCFQRGGLGLWPLTATIAWWHRLFWAAVCTHAGCPCVAVVPKDQTAVCADRRHKVN